MVVQLDGAEQPLPHVSKEPKIPRKWKPPTFGWAKLNVDGSFTHEDGRAGTGMVLRGHDGGIIFSACRSLRSCSGPLHAELEGCREGLSLSLQWTELPIALECDNLQAVSMIKETGQDR